MELREHVPLGPLTTLGVGGSARYFVEARTEDDVKQALAWAKQRGLALRVLGGGSNLVVSDQGFDGLVLAVALRGLAFSAVKQGASLNDAVLTAKAGEPWDGVVAAAVERGLCGIESLSGIPGSAGATPIQNVGAYGQEVAETIQSVRAVERESLETVELDAKACRFAYRDSYFKSEAPERFVVTEVRFGLAARNPSPPAYPDLKRELERRGVPEPSLRELRSAVLSVRKAKSMLYDPVDENGRSCGSFFLNPIVSAADAERVKALAPGQNVPNYPQPDGRVKLAAGWLIEQSGFNKALRDGNVGISTKHALALVAHAGATATDVKRLAARITLGVEQRFGVALTPEPNFW